MSLAPDRAEAGLVVGTYRYIVAGFSLPVRFVAYFAGLGGGKEEGISLVEAAARHGNAQDDAKFALLLIYTRELRHNEALAVVRELEARFPRNRILVFEEGSCALRAGRAAEAEAILTAGIDRLDRDPRPRVPGERAQWFYKRGAARLAANHRPGAAADLNAALAADPVGWVRGRIHLELAKLADLDTDRTRALAEYKQAETICVQNNDPVCSGDAERFEHRPFTLRSAQ
jgi:tetratricopeptide (TPR) repeat protein